MKKFISLALVLVMMMSICVFPAHAASDPGDRVEPLYAVTTCARCGGAGLFPVSQEAVPVDGAAGGQLCVLSFCRL